MQKKYLLNVILPGILSAVLTVLVVCRTLCPVLVLPKADLPNLVLVGLLALVAEHYLVRSEERCFLCAAVFSFLSFWLLPMAAGFTAGSGALLLGVKGCVAFTVSAWLFRSAQDRIATGPKAKAAPVAAALGLYLASQCLMGMFR